MNFALLYSLNTWGQQQATFSQYMFNGLAINPAYAGSHNVMSATASMRYQSLGLEGAPNTQTFSAHSPLLNDKVGIGVLFVRDKIGVIEQMSLNGSYAYRIGLGEKFKLAFGLQAGITTYDANYSELVILNQNDPAFQEDIDETRPNFGGGIYLNSENFYFGVSAPHLVNNVFDRGPDLTTIVQENPIMINTGYVITLSRMFTLMPNTLVKFVDGRPVEFDFNSTVSVDDVLWVGASVKAFNAVTLLTQLQITTQFRLGYSYSITSNSLRTVDLGSHEIMLNYQFKYPKDGLITPRHF